jgi:hypothetical protein
MRRYDMVSGILLILSIIDFALAAPVLVQEKRQECDDVVHTPGDVITMLGERGFAADQLDLMWDKYIKPSRKPVESSDADASSSPAPPRPDHGSTNVVQAPPPNPATTSGLDWHLSTYHRKPLSPSSTSSSEFSDDEWWYEGDGLDHELPEAHAPQPNPDARPSSDSLPVSPDARPPTETEHDVVTPPSPNLGGSKKEPESSTGSQPEDLQAAIYAAKGKAKQLRRISGTARGVGNAAQRKLQLAT